MNLLTVCELYELNGVRADWLNELHFNFAFSGCLSSWGSLETTFSFLLPIIVQIHAYRY
eukprot:COSAG02_NODE_16102_length_1113_cov_1.179487_1_plen_59_part_00